MEKPVIEKLATSIIWASVILGATLVYSASIIGSKFGRYTFSPERQNWVLVGDTKTGRSWSCVAKELFASEGLNQKPEWSENSFEGCYEMSIPSKVQKSLSYESH